MGGTGANTLPWRAIIGVIALYALLLQPFLAASAPAAARDGVLCSEHGPGGPDPAAPAGHDHACCTAAALGGPGLPPSPPSATIAWSERRSHRVRLRPEAIRLATGPPTHAHSARGPPGA